MARRKGSTTRLRTKAERMAGSGRRDLSGMSADDIRSLLHELEVHRMELELQNGELRRIESELTDSRDHYFYLYAYAPVAYLTLGTRTDIIEEANVTACTLLGADKGSIKGTRLTRFIEPASADEFYICSRRATEGPVSQSCDVRMCREDGSSFWACLEMAAVKGDGRLHVSARDVTARKEAEERLRGSEERARRKAEELAAIIDLVPAAVWIAHDPLCEVITGNRVASGICEETEKRPPAGPTAGGGRCTSRCFSRDGRELSAEEIPLQVAAREGVEVTGVELDVEMRGRGRRSMFGSAVPLRDAEGNARGAVASFVDVTERRQTERELATYGRRLEESVEERRREIALLITVMENTEAHLAYLDRDFNFVLVNSTYARGSGYSARDLVGRGHFELFPNEDNEAIFRSVRDTGEAYAVKAKPFEFPSRPERGVTYWDWSLTPVKDRSGEVVGLVLSLLDVTEKEQTRIVMERALARLSRASEVQEQRLKLTRRELADLLDQHLETLRLLQEEERRLGQLLEQLPCIQWTTDTELRFTSVLGAALGTLKAEPSQVLGASLVGVFGRRRAGKAIIRAHRRALAGRSTSLEVAIVGRSFQAYFEPLRDRKRAVTGVGGLAFDVTAAKENERTLRMLSRKLVEAQEEERRFIAHELHDEIGQSLTALAILLARGRRRQADTTAGPHVQAQQILQDIADKVRGLSLRLRPTMLDHLGLLPTLLWYFKSYTERTGVEVKFTQRGLRSEVGQDVATCAFRIVQEALTNVARHAKVADVSVRVTRARDTLNITVEDHGEGFDAASPRVRASSGVGGMHDRACTLGGELEITSAPGEGTTVRARVPLSPARDVTGGA